MLRRIKAQLRSGKNINEIEEEEVPLLHYALYSQEDEFAKELEDLMFENNIDIYIENDAGEDIFNDSGSEFFEGLDNPNSLEWRILLEGNVKYESDLLCELLIKHADHNQIHLESLIKFIKANKCNVNYAIEDNITPLVISLAARNPDITNTLIDVGARLNIEYIEPFDTLFYLNEDCINVLREKDDNFEEFFKINNKDGGIFMTNRYN